MGKRFNDEKYKIIVNNTKMA